MQYTVQQKSTGVWESLCKESGITAIGRCAESALRNLLSMKHQYDLFAFSQLDEADA